eukprot:UN06130
MKAAKNVASATARGLVTVYDELLNAGVNLVEDMSIATTAVVQHKYGDDAGEATKDGLQAVVNTVETSRNMGRIGVKALAKELQTEP